MKVLVNGREKIVPINCTVDMLCNILGIKDSEPVAVAIGENVLERDNWKSTKLNDKDKLTIIRATCGG